VDELGVDYLTLGAHKFYGPLGAAALWVAKEAPLIPMLLGGSQERRRRAGTENVPAIVGMGQAAALARLELQDRNEHVSQLRRRFEAGLGQIPDVVVHGAEAERLANTSHVAFLGVDNQSLLIRLDLAGFAVSAGSACSSGTVEPSSTALAMGLSRQEALSAIRVSFGRPNSVAEVEGFLVALRHQVGELRRLVAAAS
jgi:cysteine desulfurase